MSISEYHRPKNNLRHLVAGSVSGAAGALFVQPFDVVKTRQQQALFNDIKFQVQMPKYKTTLATVRIIAKDEGIIGLWKGSAATMYRIVPGAGLYFLLIHQITSRLKVGDQPLSAASSLFAGSAARTIVSIILLPVTVVKTRFEGFGTNSYKGTLDALKTIATREGIRGLFSGLLPTILRDAPFSGLYYLFYEKFKMNLLNSQTMPDTLAHICSGASAGAIATVLTHPQDVVKTRLQFESSSTSRRSMTQVIKMLEKEGGIKAFYRGLFPRLIRRPLLSAITWTLYEAMVKQTKRQIR